MWVTGIRCVVTDVTFRGWMTTVTWTFLADANFLNSDTAWFWTEYLSSILHRVGGEGEEGRRGGGGREGDGDGRGGMGGRSEGKRESGRGRMGGKRRWRKGRRRGEERRKEEERKERGIDRNPVRERTDTHHSMV